MHITLKATLGAVLFALAACGGQGDDTLGDNVADQAEAASENYEQRAEATDNEMMSDRLEEKADAVEEKGTQFEEQIDEADVQANQ